MSNEAAAHTFGGGPPYNQPCTECGELLERPQHVLVFEPRTGVWSWLIDSYDDGTAFITDDPHGSQAPIVDGLRRNVARAIVNAHNAALAHERSAGAVAPIDVEVLAQAMWGTSEADMHQGKAIAWAKRVAAEYARLLDAASPSAETGADE